jgi:hypothetical protein
VCTWSSSVFLIIPCPYREGANRRKSQPSPSSRADPATNRLQTPRSSSTTAVNCRQQADQKLNARLGDGEYGSSSDSLVADPAPALSHASVGQLRSGDVNSRTRLGSPHSKAIRKTTGHHKLALGVARADEMLSRSEAAPRRGRPTSLSPQRSPRDKQDNTDKRSQPAKAAKADKISPRDKLDKPKRDKLGRWNTAGMSAEERKVKRGERMQAARQMYKHAGGDKSE